MCKVKSGVETLTPYLIAKLAETLVILPCSSNSIDGLKLPVNSSSCVRS